MTTGNCFVELWMGIESQSIIISERAAKFSYNFTPLNHTHRQVFAMKSYMQCSYKSYVHSPLEVKEKGVFMINVGFMYLYGYFILGKEGLFTLLSSCSYPRSATALSTCNTLPTRPLTLLGLRSNLFFYYNSQRCSPISAIAIRNRTCSSICGVIKSTTDIT